jgi:hypothetical protein
MRLMTLTGLFAISVALLGGTPAFAARMPAHTHGICHEQTAGLCRPTPFRVEIPGAIRDARAQAKANAASKTWPGDMILG